MHHAQAVVGARHIDPRERTPRAAHQIKIPAGDFIEPADSTKGTFNDQPRARRITASGLFRQTNNTQRQGQPDTSFCRRPDGQARASRHQYPASRPSASGMPHSRPSDDNSASSTPDRIRTGTSGHASLDAASTKSDPFSASRTAAVANISIWMRPHRQRDPHGYRCQDRHRLRHTVRVKSNTGRLQATAAQSEHGFFVKD